MKKLIFILGVIVSSLAMAQETNENDQTRAEAQLEKIANYLELDDATSALVLEKLKVYNEMLIEIGAKKLSKEENSEEIQKARLIMYNQVKSVLPEGKKEKWKSMNRKTFNKENLEK